jgi:HTH-type transcriptional repressor of NAD biosynthesis genes
MTEIDSTKISKRRSLVIGKFWPPHLGHHRMIEDASTAEDGVEPEVCIIVCAAPGQTPSGSDRARWIQAIHPRADVIVVEDVCAHHHPKPCEPECTPLWAERIQALGLGPIDLVATNEPYGPGFAAALGAQHIFTDERRGVHQFSATDVRNSLADNWLHLHPITRAGMHRRVVVLGAESTGTSTLARDLASALEAPLTGEAGRTVSWELFARAGDMKTVQWTDTVFWSIVEQQIRLEHDAIWTRISQAALFVEGVGPWLVCDTDTLATVAWWERYLTTSSSALLEFARTRLADLYILTSPEGIDFDDTDPTRDGRAIRVTMHHRFRSLLSEVGAQFIEIAGPPQERLERVISAIKNHEQNNPRFVHRSGINQ